MYGSCVIAARVSNPNADSEHGLYQPLGFAGQGIVNTCSTSNLGNSGGIIRLAGMEVIIFAGSLIPDYLKYGIQNSLLNPQNLQLQKGFAQTYDLQQQKRVLAAQGGTGSSFEETGNSTGLDPWVIR